MKSFLLVLLILILCVFKSSAQLRIGYGVGVFPTGLNSLKASQKFFNESSIAQSLYGDIQDNRNYLPFYHGLAFDWSSKRKKKVNFQMNWINLHNQGESNRKNNNGIIYYHRTKSRVNSFMFGGKFKSTPRVTKYISSLTLQGFVTTHTYFYSIGAHSQFAKEWGKKEKEYDFGLDMGVNLKTGPRSQLFLHYSQGLFLFSKYNPSYVGAQLFLQLKKNKI